MPEINGISIPFLPIGGTNELNRSRNSSTESLSSGAKFGDILSDELNKVKFSQHAQTRISSRDISISDNDFSRLSTGIGRAQEKGSNESLIMVDDKAFIVSVPNRTVITVVDKQSMESNVITNIDSAVLA
jgi:flagellar operon protein